MTDLKERILRAFEGAADYDRLAGIQQEVAGGLGERIRALDLPAEAHVLEIGCGTGFLADAVGPLPLGWDWLMTDVAPAMVKRARARFAGRDGYRFALLDGEHPDPGSAPGSFDLICSSLAAQWFGDLPEALRRLFRLLKPGGRLLFSTLADGTFAEWQEAHHALGLTPGTPVYPDERALRAIRLDGQSGHIEIERFTVSHASGRDFLRTLRGIGAGTPRSGHRPLSAGEMRAVLRSFEARGAEVGWTIAYLRFDRPAERST